MRKQITFAAIGKGAKPPIDLLRASSRWLKSLRQTRSLSTLQTAMQGCGPLQGMPSAGKAQSTSLSGLRIPSVTLRLT